MARKQAEFDFNRIDPRTRRVTSALIAAVRDRIVHHVGPQKIILFGSRAKGTASGESDIDLLIILADDHPLAKVRRLDRPKMIQQLFSHRLFGLDTILMTDFEVKKIVRENEGEWDLILEIMEEGRKLYERTGNAEIEQSSSAN